MGLKLMEKPSETPAGNYVLKDGCHPATAEVEAVGDLQRGGDVCVPLMPMPQGWRSQAPLAALGSCTSSLCTPQPLRLLVSSCFSPSIGAVEIPSPAEPRQELLGGAGGSTAAPMG